MTAEPLTAEQLAKKMRRDPEAMAAYRDALLSAGVIPDDLSDEQVIDRTAHLMVAVIEFGRRLKPFIQHIGAALTRVAGVVREAEANSPPFAALMAAERQRAAAETRR